MLPRPHIRETKHWNNLKQF